jgi:uncharacterized membrane protein
MLYLEIFLVMLPIILPGGARAIADLLKEEGVQITLAMKVVYIIVVTLCCTAYIPAGVYVAREWGGILATLYFMMGFFLIAIPIAHEDEHNRDGDEVSSTRSRALTQ